MKKLFLLIVSCLVMTQAMRSQDISIKDYLDSYIDANAEPYVQPLADLFASNINTNIWEWSNIDDKFYLRFKLQGMMSFPSESMRSFQGKTTGDFRPERTITAPTILGDRNNVVLTGEDTTFYIFAGGYNLKRMTLGTPQLTVGGFLNSEVSARFLSFPLGQDLGRVRFIGLGIRHSISGYFTDPPVDVAIGYFYHHIAAGTYLDSDQHLFSAHIGKSGKFFSGQLMVGYQTSATKINYVYKDGDTDYHVNLDLTNNNPWILEANFGVRLGPVFASTALSYAKHPTVALGVGIFL